MLRRALATTATIGAIAALPACSGGGSALEEKYQQTWTKSYGATTCADWANSMSDKQRWVAAADMLVGMRSRNGDDSLPSDGLVDDFKSGVWNACVIDSMKITEVGAGVYLTERGRFAP